MQPAICAMSRILKRPSSSPLNDPCTSRCNNESSASLYDASGYHLPGNTCRCAWARSWSTSVLVTFLIKPNETRRAIYAGRRAREEIAPQRDDALFLEHAIDARIAQ